MLNKLIFIILIGTSLSACQLLPIKHDSSINQPNYKDISYSATYNPDQTLDIYLPKHPDTHIPFIIYIHGGAWKTGSNSKNDIAQSKIGVEFLASSLLTQGFGIVSINYRLLPNYHSPTQVNDVTEAVDFIRAHAIQYGLDPNRMAVMGESAGGQLAEYVAVTQGKEKILANVDFYAPADITNLTTYAKEKPTCRLLWDTLNVLTLTPMNHLFEQDLIGLQPHTSAFEAQAYAISPIYKVTAQTPPTLLLHGTDDCIVPLKHSQEYYNVLQKYHVPSELIKVEGAGHGAPVFYRTPEYTQRIINFLNSYLK